MNEPDYKHLRDAMVASQLRPNAVNDATVLAAMARIPREHYAGRARGSLAYVDTVVPLGGGRFLNPPLATGRLLSEARPRRGERALVVGAAGGYAAAVLAEIGLFVVALEEADGPSSPEIDNVERVTGPLAEGWVAGAPYDLIHVDGAIESLPAALRDQLADGGRLTAALVERGVSRLTIGRRAGEGYGAMSVADVDAAPLPGFARARQFVF